LVECDSSATADHIYKENDGVEFEHSSNPLDLRFIPDDMEFKQPPKDVASEVFNIYIYAEFMHYYNSNRKILTHFSS
jgi:hypothetical protein